jgi:hypothetical protein
MDKDYCLICEKTDEDIILVKLPVDILFKNVLLGIVGDLEPDQYICLGCIGYQFDDVLKDRAQRFFLYGEE